MKRSRALLSSGLLMAAAVLAIPQASSGSAPGSLDPLCERHPTLCPDPSSRQNYEGDYVGHDEPALLFYSNRAGSGNSNTWQLRLPREAPTVPKQDGTGGTWNFQRSIAFWFGMDLCETQSYPNPGVPCTPDSDTNIKDSSDHTSPDWMGNHVGSGFLELQFYPPGWVSSVSCDPTRWCAAMVVFGLSATRTQVNNADCLNRAGEEWANFAFITKSGVPQGPPDPLNATSASVTPDPAHVLLMDAGDTLQVSIHDSPSGLVNSITDLTSGQSGLMTASVANGFRHPLFQPAAATCTEEPYAFHPMYATSSEHTIVPWTVHTYNVSFSDEIGHFEYCDDANVRGSCVDPGVGEAKKDADDADCFNASASLLAPVGGCIATDSDFDGTSYQPHWSGTLADPARDRLLHSQSFQLTSPQTNGRNYNRMAFEADMPAIEPLSVCALDGNGCVNPPPGAKFYPIYSTRSGASGGCAWQEGGTFIPGTTNTFGGNSSAEYGPELATYYPGDPEFPEGTTVGNFRQVLTDNPCVSSGRLP
ncbi:hypothetical protein [Pedococcus sp. 5OH_020]|uniref:hypothetical protein n=1 Tax=Pedococcus sp. 5OH_020 TaxID=2989814 RepID=UPI0022E9C902|nr:hypothetical protein [Pedococcus sp. 5OH_020]